MTVSRKGRTISEIASACQTRLLLAYQYRQSGLTLAQVGAKLGVSSERARQMINKYSRLNSSAQ